MSTKKLLFSVTKKDLRIETFPSGGNGGQHANKSDTAVRITHVASGAVGESREHRSQHQNKTVAFRRMATSTIFENWRKKEAARVSGVEAVIKTEVDRQMNSKNLRIEIKDENQRWKEWKVDGE